MRGQSSSECPQVLLGNRVTPFIFKPFLIICSSREYSPQNVQWGINAMKRKFCKQGFFFSSVCHKNCQKRRKNYRVNRELSEVWAFIAGIQRTESFQDDHMRCQKKNISVTTRFVTSFSFTPLSYK